MPIALKKANPTKGSASLVFHYMGDSKFTLFFQESLKLKKAMEGYKKVVLLKFNELDPWLDLSEADERIADIIAKPTKSNIAKYLKKLTEEGYYIDIWIVGHGSPGSMNVSKGTYGKDEKMKSSEIGSLARSAGYDVFPIRMVWSTLCYGATLNDSWIKAGAKVVAGSRFVYFYPTTFGKFASEWNKGNVNYPAAIRNSDTATIRSMVQLGLIAHSKTCLREWGGKVWNINILGKGNASEKYFLAKWLDKDEWDDNKSGKENMNYSSYKYIAGNDKITKKTVPSW